MQTNIPSRRVWGGLKACQASSVRALNFFMSTLYKSNVFIPSAEARAIVSAGWHFLKAYARLGVLSYNKREPRYQAIPKIHMLFHVVHLMKSQCVGKSIVENPMTQNCAMDEDFIGRFCAITRHVSPRMRIQRSYERYLSLIILVWILRVDRE